MNMKAGLYKYLLYGCVVWGVLFGFLQYTSEYHFYLIEQQQLFLWDRYYWLEELVVPGGIATLLAEFLVQFFLLPYAGAAITALLLTSAGIGTALLLKRIVSANRLFLLSLLPVVSLLLIHLDFNYLVSGTVGYLLLLVALNLTVRIHRYGMRLLTAGILAVLLFYVAGPVSLLFAGMMFLYECCNRTPRGYAMLLICAEVFLLGIWVVSLSRIGEFKFIFLPDGYYHPKLDPKPVLYFAWLALPLLLLLAFGIRNRKGLSGKMVWVSAGAQLLLVAGLAGWGIRTYGDARSSRVKKLDYYVRTEQWDLILKECEGELSNYLYMCYLNMALAQKGELGNRMFAYDQRGASGLIVPWNKTHTVSILLSDLYFVVGDIGSAQQMAFEAYVGSSGKGNPRMLQRLVETNLIYGEYRVAEKYIALLEKSWGYARWAQEKRGFLYHDEAVANDSVLGKKRRDLPGENFLSQIYGVTEDLCRLAENNPSNRTAIEYAGALYLLNKEHMPFIELLETYYGTEVLPELPLHFQEAVVSFWENEPARWDDFGVSTPVRQRFVEFKKQVLANRHNSGALPNLLRRSYGNTYWFYFMFK